MLRYRKPSINRMLGVTKIKKAVRRATGLNTIARNTNPSRIKQRVKQKIGLYSPEMRTIRQTSKGKIPLPMVPEVNLVSPKKSLKDKASSQSSYEVQAKKLEGMQCPRCGYVLGEPIKEYKGLFFKKEYQYFLCNGCKTKYDISHIEQTWKCDFCSEKFSSKEVCEEHEKIHTQT